MSSRVRKPSGAKLLASPRSSPLSLLSVLLLCALLLPIQVTAYAAETGFSDVFPMVTSMARLVGVFGENSPPPVPFIRPFSTAN